VKEKSELAKALEVAYKEDDEILIESALNGMEVSVGVLDYKGEVIVLGITEIVPTKNSLIMKLNMKVLLRKSHRQELMKRPEKSRRNLYQSLQITWNERIFAFGIHYR
jgi:hypothetical protein